MINLVFCMFHIFIYLFVLFLLITVNFFFRFPCRWQGNDIIILDQLIVRPPYGPENLTAPESTSQAGLNRIKLVVQFFFLPSLQF